MNTYEFLLALNFWQFIGVLILAGIAGEVLIRVPVGIANAFRRRS